MGMGQILKDVLKEKGMTIKTLSDITGISKNTLYAITKRDSVNVRADNVEKIASALNISPAYLLGWSNKIGSHSYTWKSCSFSE